MEPNSTTHVPAVLPEDNDDDDGDNDFATRYLQAARDWRRAVEESERKKLHAPDCTTTTTTLHEDGDDDEDAFATQYLQAARDWRLAVAESEMKKKKKPLVPDFSMGVGPSGVSMELRRQVDDVIHMLYEDDDVTPPYHHTLQQADAAFDIAETPSNEEDLVLPPHEFVSYISAATHNEALPQGRTVDTAIINVEEDAA